MGKRGRKPSAERKGYFYEKEENAVAEYLATTDEKKRNEIYNIIIKPAFTKMIESIIRRYNLYIPDEDFEQTFSDTISFLLTKLNNFKPEKNYKAYSYCGTICKNYLIYKVSLYNKNQKRFIPFEDLITEFTNNIKYSNSIEDTNAFINELMGKIIDKINNMVSDNINLSESERKVGKALVLLLENWEQVLTTDASNKLNKSAILLFLRDNTNLTTKELRDSMKKFKTNYFNIKRNMLNN